MKTENLFILNRFGEKLETILRIPGGDGRFPTVLFVSGIGADLHETNNSHDEIATRLVSAGFLTVQFSFAGRGRSEGDYQKMTLDRQAGQIEDILNWMKLNRRINPGRNGIYAMSFGVANTLCADISSVKSLCFVSGVYFAYKAMEKMFRLKGEYKPTGISWRKFSTGEILKVGPDFWESLHNFDRLSVADKLRQPVFIVCGDRDSKIPVSDFKLEFDAIGSANKKLTIITGGDHGIIEVPAHIREKFLDDVVSWFKQTL